MLQEAHSRDENEGLCAASSLQRNLARWSNVVTLYCGLDKPTLRPPRQIRLLVSRPNTIA